MMQILLKTIIAMVVILYPIAIYFGLQHFEPKLIAVLLAALVVIRGFVARGNPFQAIKGLWIVDLRAGLAIASLS